MKTNLLTILTLALVFTLSSFAVKDTKDVYTVNTEKSKVEWLGKKVTGQHNGHISLKEGAIDVKGGKLTGGTFVMDMASITNEDLTDESMNGKLVGHLKSDDFFGVETHPTATFALKSAEKKSGNEYTVKGDLTIKGITKPIEFPATVKISGNTLEASAEVVIDRSKFDVKYGSGSFFDGLGDKMIHDDFTLDISLVATK